MEVDWNFDNLSLMETLENIIKYNCKWFELKALTFIDFILILSKIG